MSTIYNIHMIAEHPLSMEGDIPAGSDVLRAVEKLMFKFGLTPVAAQAERNDDTEELKFESKAWIEQIPSALLLGIAELFDGAMAARCDPDADTWDEKFVGYDLPFDMVDLARDMLKKKALS